MRALHFVKTFEGATWAAWQARELVRRGVEVHVATPCLQGRNAELWKQAGVTVHLFDASVKRLVTKHRRFKEELISFVKSIQPDILHSHFFSTTIALRAGLGINHDIPRIFQVPGPLHLEHGVYRKIELALASKQDFWIPSSRYIRKLYIRYGVSPKRLFLSYYGVETDKYETARSNALRDRVGIPRDALVVGNVNYIYAPKLYLGQMRGLKNYEAIIAALRIVLKKNDQVYGLLVGGAWNHKTWYEKYLRQMAARFGEGRILMPGYIPLSEVRNIWADYDCGVHFPLSENCGGVIEPLMAEVPVVAGQIGGLPDVIIDQKTGNLIDRDNPQVIASAILDVLEHRERYAKMAQMGRQLVQEMFDVRRTSSEVFEIYQMIQNGQHSFVDYDSRVRVDQLKQSMDS